MAQNLQTPGLCPGVFISDINLPRTAAKDVSFDSGPGGAAGRFADLQG
jgi:hypothetical protein